jgi:cytoskeletal protein CcmA (bactofilin family)
MAKVRDNTHPSLRTDDITTILGKGSEFEGKLNFEGTLRIEGVFSGEIHSDSVLVVGEGAKVSAEVNVGTIVINGEVRGNVRAKTGVEIRQPGRLIGNVEAPSLIIEKGVIFEGSCKMENFSTRTDSFLSTEEKGKKAEKAKTVETVETS